MAFNPIWCEIYEFTASSDIFESSKFNCNIPRWANSSGMNRRVDVFAKQIKSIFFSNFWRNLLDSWNCGFHLSQRITFQFSNTSIIFIGALSALCLACRTCRTFWTYWGVLAVVSLLSFDISRSDASKGEVVLSVSSLFTYIVYNAHVYISKYIQIHNTIYMHKCILVEHKYYAYSERTNRYIPYYFLFVQCNHPLLPS